MKIQVSQRSKIIATIAWFFFFSILFFRFNGSSLKTNNLLLNMFFARSWIVISLSLSMVCAVLAMVHFSLKTLNRFKMKKERTIIKTAAAAIIFILFFQVSGLPFVLCIKALFFLFLGLYIILLVSGAGLFLLKKVGRFDDNKIIPADAAGIGIAALSLIMFLLAVAGLIDFWLVLVLLILGSVALRKYIQQFLRLVHSAMTFDKKDAYIISIAGIIFLFIFTLLLLPPLDYDVLEYHLAAPMRYFQEGRFIPVQGNVYAAFPENAEMLYLLGIVLGKGGMWGWYLAKVLNAIMGICAAFALYCYTKRLGGKRAGFWSIVFFITSPWFFVLSIKCYAELYLTLFVILAMGRLFLAVKEKNVTIQNAGLIGLFCGAAAGAKYTALLFLFVPVMGLYLVYAALPQDNNKRLKLLKSVLIFLLVFLCVFSPWLIKNTVCYQNPVFPLMGGSIGGGDWQEADFEKFNKGHAPGHFSITGFIRSLGRETVYGQYITPLFLLFVPFILFSAKGKRPFIYAAGYFLVFFLLWYLFTHRITRFMFPASAVLCMAGGAGAAAFLERYRRAGVAIILFCLVYCIMFPSVFYIQSTPHWIQDEAGWREENLSKHQSYIFSQYANHLISENNKILLIGDAQTFYLRKGYISGTVFDRKWIEQAVLDSENTDDIHARLKDKGIRYLYIDWTELARFAQTYGEYFSEFNWLLFERFLAEKCSLEKSWGPSVAPIISAYPEPEHEQILYLSKFKTYFSNRQQAAGEQSELFMYELYKVN